ncbi:MAG: integrase arm-type DNA-binding domain-containing protein, partial [Arenimonas sp.]|nr:integrase arm-type DNA-binding domain-containing protein [Arenimonas sp.]
MKLTAIAIKNAKPGRHGDGNNLYLLVKRDGRKSWVFRYRDRLTQKTRDKGLGPLRDVSLASAREKAREYRAALASGKDPIELERTALHAARSQLAKQVTFDQCASQCIAAIQHEWKNSKHKAQWTSTITTHCRLIGPLPVSEIDADLVHRVLEPIWLKRTETASRVRSRIERILDWAAGKGFRTGDNPASWKGSLKSLLASPAKIKKVKHRPALPHADVVGFMAELRLRNDISSAALQLQILTATRPSEATEAKWQEFDFARTLWTIPKERMKSNRPHAVPLSKEAVSLLRSIPSGVTECVFVGPKGKPITTAAVLKTVHAIRPNYTSHGFRS